MVKAQPRQNPESFACSARVLLAAAFLLIFLSGFDSVTWAQAVNSPLGFALPKEDDTFKTAMEDFERYRDKKQWAAAFRALSTVLEGPIKGYSSSADGFLVPAARRIQAALLTLPPDGIEAYRLFFDAKADQLYKQATAKPDDGGEAAVDDVPLLKQIVEQFYLTTRGVLAADRLGDAYFESGSFNAAAEVWRSLLTDYPDAQLPAVRLYVKRGVALARMQQWEAFDDLVHTVATKFAGESVPIAGQPQEVVTFLQSLRTTLPTAPPLASESDATLSALPTSDKAAWRTQFLDDEGASNWKTVLAQTGWGRMMDPLDATVPSADVDDKRIYTNWLGIVFAVDLKTGKLVWRSNKFTELSRQGIELIQQGIDASQYAVTVSGPRVYAVGAVGRNGVRTVPLRCLDAETGSEKWSTLKGGETAGSAFCGAPLINGDALYAICVSQGSTNMELQTMNPETGVVQKRLTLGTAAGTNNFRGEQISPTPLMKIDGTTLYVLTNNGAVIAVDLGSNTVRWALKTDPPKLLNRQDMVFFSDAASPAKVEPPGVMLIDRGMLYFKERGTRQMYALDPSIPRLVWQRPLEKEQSPVASRDGKLLTVGVAAGAIDATNHALLWSNTLLTQTGNMRPVFTKDQEIIFAGRGLYVISTNTGELLKIIRGADRGAVGGNLFVAGGKLLSVSNRSVTAYALPN